jgi:methionyl-tRNA formyltransferase
MRAFFIGTVEFSRQMLNRMLANPQVEIVGLATKSNSSFNSDHSDLSDIAIENGIPFKYVRDINAPHIVNWITHLRPHVIFCLGWSSLITKELIAVPTFGVIGYHPAELPNNKGRHPQIWAMVLGLEYTASTFFLIDEGADSGDIINQTRVKIDFEDTAGSLYSKLVHTARLQLNQIVSDLTNSSINRISQKESTGNHWRKRSKMDGRIDWRMRSNDIYNLVRALGHPYIGAHFDYQGNEIKVWKCAIPQIDNLQNLEPGKVHKIEDQSIFVKTGDGFIQLIEHELDVKEIQAYLA